ncbi:hypothetical protein [Hyphomicrobium sp. CS1GBMeth3]|uniref:hypothetical protein n=1 Tax=Hyphomicrobium sp. CS1GBMeth3 TaxID=1892845 RepID=UPI000930EB4A|nr:hypothetical protein [Hyphomicrobium sp. CS1GBMeth3]
MGTLSAVLLFVIAHIVAWSALGGGWRGAARAPFAVFLPALALLLLNAVVTDSFESLGATVMTLVTWEMLYLFLYVCLRLISRPITARQALPRR